MRRGPQLFYERMRTATGFGLNVEEVQVTRRVKGTGGQADEEGYTSSLDESSNVLDWSNSSMLAFVSLFYASIDRLRRTNAEPWVQIWPLVRRSTQKDQLSRNDLPHLEQYIRQSGIGQMRWETDKEGLLALDDSPDGLESTRRQRTSPKEYTNWSLLKATWSGRGGVILSCEE